LALQILAIVAEALGVDLKADYMKVGPDLEEVAEVAVESWPPEEADHGGALTSASLSTR
jgi:hypothetical protein